MVCGAKHAVVISSVEVGFTFYMLGMEKCTEGKKGATLAWCGLSVGQQLVCDVVRYET